MKNCLSNVVLGLLPLLSLLGLATVDLPPPTEEQTKNQNKTLLFGLVRHLCPTAHAERVWVIDGHVGPKIVFPGFEPLDVWGPLELLYMVRHTRLTE